MFPEKFWDWLEREWAVLKGAPLAFVLVLAAGLAIGFAASDHLGAREVAAAKQEAVTARAERDLSIAKLNGATPDTWQPLTDAQIEALAEKVRPLGAPGRSIIIQCPSPRQCGRFADSLTQAFKRAGSWDVGRIESPPQHSGLWIFPPDKEAATLQSALMPILGLVQVEQGLEDSGLLQRHWLAIGEKAP